MQRRRRTPLCLNPRQSRVWHEELVQPLGLTGTGSAGDSARWNWLDVAGIESEALLLVVLSNTGYWEGQAVAAQVASQLADRVLAEIPLTFGIVSFPFEESGMEKEGKDLIPAKTGPVVEKPEAVLEAEKDLRRWGLGLAGTGAVGSIVYWLALIQFDLYFPLQWWFVFLATLVVVFFFPPNRGPRNARELLRRWDDLKIQRLLEEGGASPDPTVRVAEEMAERVAGHPQADKTVRQVASELLSSIRRTAQDRRTIRLLQQSGVWNRENARERTLSDVLDHISGREGELLASLEKLHRAVVKRDASAAAELSSEARRLLAQLDAEEEVNKLLSEEGQ